MIIDHSANSDLILQDCNCKLIMTHNNNKTTTNVYYNAPRFLDQKFEEGTGRAVSPSCTLDRVLRHQLGRHVLHVQICRNKYELGHYQGTSHFACGKFDLKCVTYMCTCIYHI